MTQSRIDRRQALTISVCAPAMNGCKRDDATNTELKMPDAPISLRDLQEFDSGLLEQCDEHESAEPGGFGVVRRLPRLGYRGRFLSH